MRQELSILTPLQSRSIFSSAGLRCLPVGEGTAQAFVAHEDMVPTQLRKFNLHRREEHIPVVRIL
jgi:hypothetical protein